MLRWKTGKGGACQMLDAGRYGEVCVRRGVPRAAEPGIVVAPEAYGGEGLWS